jgi:DNA-binding winged helix-turn-helix (wHTH) protein/TolB-like protein
MARIRFGIFDFDAATGELRREGAPVRLQSQPAQVLAVLMAHPGEVVSRETLRSSVWGAETFVDFDGGLNFCIAQIRSALGDSAETPLYVRTVPKRGYQFVAPVAADDAPNVAVRHASNRRVLAGCLAAVVLAFGGWELWRGRAAAVAIPTTTLAVAHVDNDTGSPEFDRFALGLTDSLIAEFAASGEGKYSVIGNAAILRLPRGQRDLAAIGASLKASYIVLSSVKRKGEGFEVFAQLIGLPDQKHIRVMRLQSTVAELPAAENAWAPRIKAEFSRWLIPRPPTGAASHVPVTN